MRRLALLLLILPAACGRPAPLFVEANAVAHVSMLAGTIGSRPVGTPANAKARAYIVDQLEQLGFDVRVQETDARRHELGRTARVSNIIARLPGQRPEALGLISHYDSSPDAPGATDDALAVAVSLEAARQIAAGGPRQWTLLVLVTDGEESGLMGAAALVTDRDVTDRLRAYVNLESIGSSGTPVLFETGPGNAWLVKPWARSAPHPRGASYGLEVYQRLPNDTDFSILKTRDIPGLNFAPVGDSYAYHTARDTPERLSRETIRSSGENVVAIVTALQSVDITQRVPQAATFFDIGGTAAVSYGPVAFWVVTAAALVLGVIAWVRISSDAIRMNGILRWILMLFWGWLGAVLVVTSMIGATWLLRSARAVYHPWYARPGRLFVLLIAVALTIGWGMARLGRWLPRRAHPVRHAALVWSAALPAWLLLAALSLGFAPSAAYLWALPLFTAGLLLSVLPPSNIAVLRVGSLLVLVVSATLWLRETHDLLRFVVAVMGRLPLVTPAFVYAAILTTAGIMIVPPLVAVLGSSQPLRRPGLVTAALLLGVAASTIAAYRAPAYTREQPLRRSIRALQDGDRPSALWEVASVEPGLDLGPDAPSGWMPGTAPVDPQLPPLRVPWGNSVFPFVFRTAGPSLGPAPASVSSFNVKPLPEGSLISVSIAVREPGLAASFILPAGITPARSSLPGRQRLGRWTATFIAVPAEGLAWEASVRGTPPERLRDTYIAITSSRLPGGSGWQSLPGWLPQESAVWSASATWILAAPPETAIAPVPPLR
jgi:hypothetical protein